MLAELRESLSGNYTTVEIHLSTPYPLCSDYDTDDLYTTKIGLDRSEKPVYNKTVLWRTLVYNYSTLLLKVHSYVVLKEKLQILPQVGLRSD